MILATSWTPEQWVAIVTAITSGVGAMVVAIIGALKTRDVHVQNQDIQREIKPPSNGVTLGTIVERIDQVLSALAQSHLEDKGGVLEIPTSKQVSSSIPNPNPGLTVSQQVRSDLPSS